MNEVIMFKFLYKNDLDKFKISRSYFLNELLNITEDDIYYGLINCECQPIGETNVVECSCDEELEGFTLYGNIQFTGQSDKNKSEIYKGHIIKIDRYDEPLIGEVKQLKGGQYYIDHKKVNLKYSHQIHCEICDTDSLAFFLDFFDAYELEIIGNIYETPELINDRHDSQSNISF